MDAASNNSVDDIRDLRERVAYAPVSGRHKVYILDEAHMLSTAAWNAFLKTLEEPPPNTIFVLATTEANKVLPTVVDRCHRFDFGRPTVGQIASVLRRVADEESIEIPDEAFALVARSATGSFRDALGTLEQLVAYSGTTIALDDVLAVLGAADADLLFGAVDAVAAGDARGRAARRRPAGRVRPRRRALLRRPRGPRPRRCWSTQTLGEVPAELSRHARARRAPGRAGPPRRPRRRRAAARSDRRRPARDEGRRRRPHPARARAGQGGRAGARAVDKALLARMERLEARAGAPPAPRPAGRAPELAATAAGRAASPPGRPTRPLRPCADPAPARRGPAGGAPTRAPEATVAVAAHVEGATTTVAVAVAEADAPAQVAALELHSVAELWPAVLDSLRQENGMLAAALHAAHPARLGEGELTLAWPTDARAASRKAEDPSNRDAIARAIRAVTGTSLRLALRAPRPTPPTRPPARRRSPRTSWSSASRRVRR